MDRIERIEHFSLLQKFRKQYSNAISQHTIMISPMFFMRMDGLNPCFKCCNLYPRNRDISGLEAQELDRIQCCARPRMAAAVCSPGSICWHAEPSCRSTRLFRMILRCLFRQFLCPSHSLFNTYLLRTMMW